MDQEWALGELHMSLLFGQICENNWNKIVSILQVWLDPAEGSAREFPVCFLVSGVKCGTEIQQYYDRDFAIICI